MKLFLKNCVYRLLTFSFLALLVLVFFVTFIINDRQSIADTFEGEVKDGFFEAIVKDSQGRVSSYVSVEVSGPSGRFSRVTDSDGSFLIPYDFEDDEGTYTFTIMKGGTRVRFSEYLSGDGSSFRRKF